MSPSINPSMPSNTCSLSRQQSISEKFARSISPPPTLSTMNCERSLSRQSPTHKQKQNACTQDQPPHQFDSNYLQPPTYHDHDYLPFTTNKKLKKAGTISHSSPSRKLSSSNFIRMARQASDTAFRTVGIRKGSDSNLNAAWKADQYESSGVYEQNPKVYLYQHQQQQQNVPPRPLHARPYADKNMTGDWAMNNQLLNQYEELPIGNLSSERLRRNVSLPDLKVQYTKDVSREPTVTATTRAASPGSLLLPPGQATNRCRSRPRLQPHHFLSNEPRTSLDETSLDETSSVQASDDPVHRPHTPQRSPSRAKATRAHTLKARSPRSIYPEVAREHHHEEKPRKRALPKQETSSDEGRPPVPTKSLPPIPQGPPPPLPSSSKTLPNEDVGSVAEELSPPILPAASETLKRNGSNGLIPQDVLRNMDPKEVQKAINATVIASRVYKVMSSEQIEVLKKEQNELTDFVETMNVSLHIESRMRDASHSLILLHVNNSNIEAVKAAISQHHGTTRKMDQIVQRSQEAMSRLLTIQRLLLQHEGAILNASLRRLDRENRELSRTVMQLESARGQEKEEKIKWKKEHNRLKFQSIIFPTTPVWENFVKSVPGPDVQLLQEQHEAQMASMETYVKELNDDILQKDEKVVDLTNQLQAVKEWADDFESSVLDFNKPESMESDDEDSSSRSLQEQLRQLQSTVECELKERDVHVQDLKSKVELLSEENSSLAWSFNSILASQQESRPSREEPQQPQQQREGGKAPRFWRHTKAHSRQGSDLRMVLQDSLLELDRQIQLDENQSLSSSCSSRPSSTSTSATSFSFDSFDQDEMPLSRRSSGGRSSGKLSRTHSSSSSSASLGLRAQVLTRIFNHPEEVSFQDSTSLSYSGSEDEIAVEDANREIRRLNVMVKHLERRIGTSE